MDTLKKTPLRDWHAANGGRLVDFAGWEMPVQFAGIIDEHKATRTLAGLFDVSHMGELFLEGPDALENLTRILTNDPRQMSIGQVIYSPMCYENGTIVDDLSLYKLADEKYMLCVNASNTDKDFAWIQQNLKGQVTFTNRSAEFGQIAIQGPRAETIVNQVIELDTRPIRYWWFAKAQFHGVEIIVARMGYTGEDGFEIFVPKEATLTLWETLYSNGIGYGLQPIGLGARDTLRLEVAYPLYGNDIDDKHLATAAVPKRFIKMDKDFIGKKALEAAPKEQLCGIKLLEKGVPRPHYPLTDSAGKVIGEVTSGTHSPMLEQGIALAYVQSAHNKVGNKIKMQIRNKSIDCEICALPFYKPQK